MHKREFIKTSTACEYVPIHLARELATRGTPEEFKALILIRSGRHNLAKCPSHDEKDGAGLT